MLKGKSKIELFDAKTGELVKTVERNNLVTNAVRNVLNGMNQAALISVGNTYGLGDTPYQIISALQTDPYKKLYGGLLVFADEIQEGADHIIPTASEMKTYIGGGYQGATATGSNLGTLNTDESEVTDTYAKFVWDFTTQQCNGNIACICLTSDVGGWGGFGIKSSSDSARTMSFLRPARMTNFFGIQSGASTPPARRYLGTNTSGQNNWRGMDDKYVYYVNGGIYRFGIGADVKQSVLKNLSRSFSGAEKINNTDLYQNGYSMATSFDKGKLYAYHWNNGGTRIYDAESNLISTYSSNFSGVKDELNTFIGTGDIANIHCKFVKGGYLYVVAYNTTGATLADKKIKVFKINMETGAYSSHTIQLTSDQLGVVVPDNSKSTDNNKLAYMQLFRGSFIADIAATGCYTYIDLTNFTVTPLYRHYVYASEDGKAPTFFESGKFPDPWLLMPFANWSNEIFCPYMFFPYLATINNQDTVLEKDATKTMKITYTIYEEQD